MFFLSCPENDSVVMEDSCKSTQQLNTQLFESPALTEWRKNVTVEQPLAVGRLQSHDC